MIRQNHVVNVHNMEPRDTFISISLALYILASYLIRTPLTIALGSAALYLFLGLTLFKTLTRQTPLKITSYSLWYLAFGALGSLSLFYAINTTYVINALYTILVILILTFSFIQYIRNYASIVRIFSFHAYSPIFLVVYLFLTGTLSGTSYTPSERLGDSLFGNANKLAGVMMISLFCIAWLIVYKKRKHLLLDIILSITYFYIIALSGGRKYFLVPFVFMLLLLFFKYQRENKQRLVLIIIFFILIVFLISWAITNVPSLHNSIGVRFESMFNLLNGGRTDGSIRKRIMMIEYGWMWFLQRPFLGYGLDNFRVNLSEYLKSMYAHNNFIELMVDLGMVGTSVYYSFYAYIVAKLIKIRDDVTGIRNFFLAFMLALLILEISAVTYNIDLFQTFIGLASAYVWLYNTNHKVIVKVERQWE